MENKPPVRISEETYKNALSSAVYRLTLIERFYGNLLQELTVKRNAMVPTAGITYNTKTLQFEIYINPQYFCTLTPAEMVGVFHHEILHFTNKHLFRLPFLDEKISNTEKKYYNIAADMAINQYIKDLPKGCVDVKEWKLDDGKLFPTYKTMEEYHSLIKHEEEKQNQNNKDGKGEGKGSKGNVPENLDKYKEFDSHMWDSLDEETKQQMLGEARKLVKRTIEKTSQSHSTVPDSVKDLLEEIETLSAKMNYKRILKEVIKRTVCCSDRESTWRKPNKRYGVYSPGTRVGALPKLEILVDTSGSISITEMNQFFNVISGFLQAGSRTCDLALWHTSLYYKKKYKLYGQLVKEELESGGTDITCALQEIKKSNPNLAIILTDGYYDKSDIKIPSEVIFIISKGGNKDHPMKHLGKTIPLERIL